MTTSLLVGARPGSWHGRNCHGADKHVGNIEGGGDDVAGTMGRLGDVPSGCLGLSWFGRVQVVPVRIGAIA